METLEHIDLGMLRSAIERAQRLADLASPIVLSFDQYAKRITNPQKQKTLNQEMLALNAALKLVLDNGNVLEKADSETPSELSAERKRELIGALVNVRLGICDAMRVVTRTVPKRNKLHERANKLLSRINARTVFGVAN